MDMKYLVKMHTYQPSPAIIAFAKAGYLPVSISQDGQIHWNIDLPDVLREQAGKWSWNDPWNPFILGALYNFERSNGLPVRPGRYGWKKLPEKVKQLIQSNQYVDDPNPWTWVLVKRGYSSETATLYRSVSSDSGFSMDPVFTTAVNTGVFNGTPLGTWPVYLRYKVTSMRGSMVVSVPQNKVSEYQLDHENGASWKSLGVSFRGNVMVHKIHYDDHGIKWVSYFHRGDALHYFPRKTYGWPQSAGCVEMPEKAAKKMWNDIGYGTLVSIVH